MAWGTQDSFAGIGINVLNTGRSRSSRNKLNVREVPGGNVVVINDGGKGVRRRQYDIYVPDEDTLRQLEEFGGTTGDLVYWGGTARIKIEEIDAGRWWDGGRQEARISCIVVSEQAIVGATPPPLASFVWANTGFDVEFDANSSTSADGLITEVNWEFGDTTTWTQTPTPPATSWATGGANIPTYLKTYATPGEKVVNMSVRDGAGRLSADYSLVVTVSG